MTERADDTIDRRQLTKWAVMPGGEDIRLGLSTPDGKTSDVVFSFDALSSLLMTLPCILQAALDTRCSDGSLRVAQLLESWRIEQAQGHGSLILRLATQDGFEVAFALSGKDTGSLGMALITTSRMTEAFPRRPH